MYLYMQMYALLYMCQTAGGTAQLSTANTVVTVIGAGSACGSVCAYVRVAKQLDKGLQCLLENRF